MNVRLTSWKVPENDFTRDKKVTLRGILSHTAGLTVHGFPGYAVSAPLPTVIQVLDGTPPANTAAIRVDVTPGTLWRYSGGGYTVMQELLTDVTGQPFPELLRRLVLAPIGMTHSTFQQPLPPERVALTARGHLADLTPVQGRFHVYPEMAAAGLWTTASDLARFVMELQQTLAGKPGRVVSRDTARLMVSEVRDGDGLGVFVKGKGRFLQLSHDGRDEGFDAFLIARAETGQGAVILINVNDNSRMVQRIVRAIATEYRWPTDEPAPQPVSEVAADAAALARVAGRYEIANNNLFTLVEKDGKLFTSADGLPDDALVSVGPGHFSTVDGAIDITFTEDQGSVASFSWKRGDESGIAPRVGPLAEGLVGRSDPDAALTARILTTVHLLAAHDNSPAAVALLTPGARRDLAPHADTFPDATQLTGLVFLDAQDVAGRGIERHEGKVARVLTYARQPTARPRFVLVYLTADGHVTDFDGVDE